MKRRSYAVLCMLLLMSAVAVSAQSDSTNRKTKTPSEFGDRFFNFNINYGFQVPKGDLEKRFTAFSQLGFGVSLKTHRNFNFGIHGSYMWGGAVRETDVLQNIMTSAGTVIDKDGGENRLAMSLRGSSFMGLAGKVISFGRNKNTGLMLQLGAGYFQHHIAFTNFSGKVTQLEGDYRKGYERRTAGPLLHSFIGYHYMNTRFFSGFYTGISFDYARTQPLANIDYSTGRKGDSPRNDMMIGLRFVWIIPVPLSDLRDYGGEF